MLHLNEMRLTKKSRRLKYNLSKSIIVLTVTRNLMRTISTIILRNSNTIVSKKWNQQNVRIMLNVHDIKKYENST